MRTTLNLLFSLRKPKNYQSGDMPIYLRITVDGQRAEVAVNPTSWAVSRNSRKLWLSVFQSQTPGEGF